jgi:fructosamine-3-kinase
MLSSPRQRTYYWKCDRPAAFHGTTSSRTAAPIMVAALRSALTNRYPGTKISIQPAHGQGNHVTFMVHIDGEARFLRVEDGPEQDNHLIVESRVLGEVRALGLPAPLVHQVDVSRSMTPFAWQMLDLVPFPDLNALHKEGRLDLPFIAREIGCAIAHWQCFQPPGYGPFDPQILAQEDRLGGFHSCYEDYFFLHFERHLQFLAQNQFLSAQEIHEIESAILEHRELLALDQGCLVHKDLALWNILGEPARIAAFIDWDDAISGDPMDDLSLLGCFYEGDILARALEGYQMLRPLPADHQRRFWLHLLRNMLVKAVIRVGAGYFERSDGFFLIGTGRSGLDLRTATRSRIAAALNGLRDNQAIDCLAL